MHTDSEMTGISRLGSMHYMTAASLEMSDEPFLRFGEILTFESFPHISHNFLYYSLL